MNASNPRTALTTSASRLLALLTGEQKAAGCAPGQAVLGCCLSPAGYQTPGLPSGWTASTRNWQTPVLSGSTWGSPSPGGKRRRLPPRPADLWPQQRAWTSPSPWSTRGGRSRWRSSLPSTSTCCCTSASGPLCRPGCRSCCHPCRGLRPPFPPFPLFYTLFCPFVGETHLGSESKVGFLFCMPGGRRKALADAVTGQGPGFSPAAPDGKGALRFLTAQQFCKVFFLLIHFSPFFFDIFCLSLLILQPI